MILTRSVLYQHIISLAKLLRMQCSNMLVHAFPIYANCVSRMCRRSSMHVRREVLRKMRAASNAKYRSSSDRLQEKQLGARIQSVN